MEKGRLEGRGGGGGCPMLAGHLYPASLLSPPHSFLNSCPPCQMNETNKYISNEIFSSVPIVWNGLELFFLVVRFSSIEVQSVDFNRSKVGQKTSMSKFCLVVLFFGHVKPFLFHSSPEYDWWGEKSKHLHMFSSADLFFSFLFPVKEIQTISDVIVYFE